MQLALLVYFQDKTRQPEEPMGDFEFFNTIKEFIDFNLEQIDELIALVPRIADEQNRIAEKLRTEDFAVRHYAKDQYYIVVTDI